MTKMIIITLLVLLALLIGGLIYANFTAKDKATFDATADKVEGQAKSLWQKFLDWLRKAF